MGRGLLVALCTATAPAAAGAQSAPSDQINAIEREIRHLQGELQQLKRELSEAKKRLRQSQSEMQRSHQTGHRHGRYDLQSSNDFLLLERPAIIDIARKLAAGGSRASAGFKLSTDRYFFSSYLTGAKYGQNSTSLNGEQLGFAGRVAGRPYYDKDWNVNLGMSGQAVFHPNLMKSGTPFVSQETLTLQVQPECGSTRTT